MLCCQFISPGAQSQISQNEIALEDAAFNKAFTSRSIPTVTGKLLNISAEELKKLSITYSRVTPFSTGSVKGTVIPKADGTFSIPIDYAFPYQEIWFSADTLFYAGLYANKDLYVELDVRKLKASKERVSFNGDGVRYLGTDGPLNIYLNNYTLYQRDEQLRLSGNAIMLLQGSGSGKNDNVLSEYNKLQDSIRAIESSYITANPSPYSWLLENERLSEYYAKICFYFRGKVLEDTLWQKIKQHKAYLVSNQGSGFYTCLSIYISFLPGNSRDLKKDIARADSLFATPKADFMKLQLNSDKVYENGQSDLDHILNSTHTPWCSTVLKNEYNRTTGKTNEINKALARSTGDTKVAGFGEPVMQTPFGAGMYKAPEKIKALDFLVSLKQNFPGKAIIIDLWATWCHPCLSEMPHGKKLQEASTDLPVVFIYLCTTDNVSENEWKEKVAELKQPGVHILINERLTAELSGYLSFTGYPGHAYIDRTGQYKPGAINGIGEIPDRQALITLINK
jgi:thiol-disulfide isomerase/thioredoxin